MTVYVGGLAGGAVGSNLVDERDGENERTLRTITLMNKYSRKIVNARRSAGLYRSCIRVVRG